MANCLRMPMASSLCCSSSFSVPSPRRRTSGVVYCSKFPMPPLNPKDPFLSRLASAAAKNPDQVLNGPRDSDTPPYLDIFGFSSPKQMAQPAHVETSRSYATRRPRRPPPDLPSLLLDGRVVYIGMPLVPAVTELIIAQLQYLRYESPKEPIYLYINSTGTTQDDGEPIALETEGFAVYDALMLMNTEIRTVCLGVAMGHACLFLAAGTKGKRCMLPHATASFQEPSVAPSGLMQASDIAIQAKEVLHYRDTFIRLMAKHTRNSEETVANAIKMGPFNMNAIEAIKFGVIDKILWRGQEQEMRETAPPEYWDKSVATHTDI